MMTSSLNWIFALLLLLLISCDSMNRSEVYKIKDPQKATEKLLELAGSSSAELAEIQHLIDQGADVDAVHPSSGRTPLHRASENGCPQTVAALIHANANINAKYSRVYTPLLGAIYNDHTEVVAILVDAKADVNAANAEGETPLHLAAMGGNVQIAELLLAAKADVEAANFRDGQAPIHEAALAGHTQIITLLLKAGANANAVSHAGSTALHRAILHGETESVRTLLDGGANVDLADKRGETPLHYAAGNLEMVTLLLNAGARVNPVNKEYGNTPLHSAMCCKDSGVIEALLRAGADAIARNKWGETPLHFASGPRDAAVLLKAKAEVNAVTKGGGTPLYYASGRGLEPVVGLLLKAGAGVNIASDIGGTPLSYAVQEGHARIVDTLIEAGADVDQADTRGTTPLLVAASNGHGAIVAALLKAGANTRVEAMVDGAVIHTALSIAKEKHHDDIVELLKLHSKTRSGKGFVRAAATLGLKDLIDTLNADDVERLRRLLKEGADVNIKNKMGETPLCASAKGGYLQLVDLLIAADADVNAGCLAVFRNTPEISADASLAELMSALMEMTESLSNPTVIENYTPLHWSANTGNKQIAAALLKAQADVNAKAYYAGQPFTPLGVADNMNHLDIVELLSAHGARDTDQ